MGTKHKDSYLLFLYHQKVVVLSAEQALQLAGGEGSVVVTVTDEGDEEDGKMNLCFL